MGKIMEALFCVFYMITVVILGAKIVRNGKNKKEILWFGIMSLVLVFGDAFHLVPRVLEAIDKAGDYHAAKGIGTLITSVTMTVFYLIMYFVYSIRYEYENRNLKTNDIYASVIHILNKDVNDVYTKRTIIYSLEKELWKYYKTYYTPINEMLIFTGTPETEKIIKYFDKNVPFEINDSMINWQGKDNLLNFIKDTNLDNSKYEVVISKEILKEMKSWVKENENQNKRECDFVKKFPDIFVYPTGFNEKIKTSLGCEVN